MPTYEFRCPQGHEFERFYRTISGAASEAECPECGAIATRILSAGAGLVFKGSGFYLTDYGKNAHRKPAAASGSKEGGTKAEGGGESKSEAKPEAKAESKPESKSDSGKSAEGTAPKAKGPKPSSE